MKQNKTARLIRGGLLALLLAWVTYESIMHQILGGGKSPSIHALCPYGGLESLYALVMTGSLIQKVFSGTLVLLVITIVIAILFRRSFCGLLCPFGALQELFARIGSRIWKKRPTVPVKADRYLRYLKYVILALTTFMAWRVGSLWMTSYDPYAAYAHITVMPGTLAEDPLSIVGFILLGITLLGSFVYDRFFCKYLCPAGALYGIIGKISPTKIIRNNDACIHCNLCTKSCPVNLDVAKMDKVLSAECLNCNECVAVCPKKGALEIKTFKKSVPPLVMVILVAGLFFIPISIAQLTGYYHVLPESTAITSFIEIKGYMTISDAAKALNLPEDKIRTALRIPVDVPSATKMKDLSTMVPGYDFDAAKENAATIGTTEDPALPSSPGKTDTPVQTGEATATVDASGVRGSMTITDAAAAIGLPEKELYSLFKIPESVSSSTRMKDISKVVAGYDFEAMKSALDK